MPTWSLLKLDYFFELKIVRPLPDPKNTLLRLDHARLTCFDLYYPENTPVAVNISEVFIYTFLFIIYVSISHMPDQYSYNLIQSKNTTILKMNF